MKQIKSASLDVVLPLTTASSIAGLKVDSLVAAMRKGQIKIRFARLKPGGKYQPLVTVEDLRRFAEARAKKYGSMKSDYHRAMAKAASDAKLPPDRVSWDDAFGI